MWRLTKNSAASVLVALAVAAPPHTPAAPGARQCPRVVVNCPDRAVGGQVITFTVELEGFKGSGEPTYNWTTSAGTISAGQGTSVVNVDTTGLPLLPSVSVVVTVEVGGLPEGCPKA